VRRVWGTLPRFQEEKREGERVRTGVRSEPARKGGRNEPGLKIMCWMRYIAAQISKWIALLFRGKLPIAKRDVFHICPKSCGEATSDRASGMARGTDRTVFVQLRQFRGRKKTTLKQDRALVNRDSETLGDQCTAV